MQNEANRENQFRGENKKVYKQKNTNEFKVFKQYNEHKKQ